MERRPSKSDSHQGINGQRARSYDDSNRRASHSFRDTAAVAMGTNNRCKSNSECVTTVERPRIPATEKAESDSSSSLFGGLSSSSGSSSSICSLTPRPCQNAKLDTFADSHSASTPMKKILTSEVGSTATAWTRSQRTSNKAVYKEQKVPTITTSTSTVEKFATDSVVWKVLLLISFILIGFFLISRSFIFEEFSSGRCRSSSDHNSLFICDASSRFARWPLPLLFKIKISSQSPHVVSRKPSWVFPSFLVGKRGETSSINSRLEALEKAAKAVNALQTSEATEDLKAHTSEFRKRIEKINDRVYIAIGYGLANTVLIKTSKGLLLIDCLEEPSQMETVMREFKKNFTNQTEDLRVIALILSHFHSDHISGASAIYQPNYTEVWAHELTLNLMHNTMSGPSALTYARSMKQFGSLLSSKDGFINSGIGRNFRFDRHSASAIAGVINPNKIWNGQHKNLTIGDIDLELYHAPGESSDQTIVWLPQYRILYGADNIYKAFPNIYAIRGTPSRDALLWVKSLDLMISLKAEKLLLGHTGIVLGEKNIEETLTIYRDAIQYIHDQTIRLMNKNMPLEKIVKTIKLPSYIHPYLQSHYGTVEWGVRAIFHHYMGWFDGEVENLQPLTPSERARNYIALLGGFDNLLNQALNALEHDDYQWSLELIQHYLHLKPDSKIANRLKYHALIGLAAQQKSASARNWYLTTALQVSPQTSNQIEQQLKISKAQRHECFFGLNSGVDILNFLPLRLNADYTGRFNAAFALNLTDTKKRSCAIFRRGILQLIHDCSDETDLEILVDDLTWRRLASQEIRPWQAVLFGKLRVKSRHRRGPLNYWTFRQWMKAFEIEVD